MWLRMVFFFHVRVKVPKTVHMAPLVVPARHMGPVSVIGHHLFWTL